jgi:tetratricopeptide (TPR) repeat protein
LEFYAEQNWTKALATFEQLAQVDPNFSTANEYIAKIKAHLSSADYTPGTSANADSLFRKNRPSNQGNDSVKVPDNLNNFDDRKRELESQLKRDPSNINIQRELDKVSKGQDDESEKIYKEGLIAYSQGNRGLAIQQWKQVLVINPDHKKASAALKKARAEEDRSADEMAVK